MTVEHCSERRAAKATKHRAERQAAEANARQAERPTAAVVAVERRAKWRAAEAIEHRAERRAILRRNLTMNFTNEPMNVDHLISIFEFIVIRSEQHVGRRIKTRWPWRLGTRLGA